MSVDFDTIVIGAGVIGLAVARQLAVEGQSVLVLEAGTRAGAETSSRNSEVIHAGIYYPAGSLKAQLCVEGRALLYDFCETHGVATQKPGKLIVATSAVEEAKLHAIASLATANGVHDLHWLSPAEVAHMEPEIRCTRALFSPSTGIVDASGFMLALHGEAESHGAIFAFNTCFQNAHKREDVFVVQATDRSGEVSELSSRALVNCAGHGAHAAAGNIAGYPSQASPPRYLAKGSYCSVSGRNPFTHLIYPVPVQGALGIHATLDLAGAVRFGPDIQWVDDLDYTMPPGLPGTFSTAVELYWPNVRDRILTASYCGIRPKIHGPDAGFADFVIDGSNVHGVSGLVTLFGIESPGLTASMAIANKVARELHV